MIIEKICSRFNITEGEITAACDGLDAIRMEIYKDTSLSSKTNNFDMLSEIDANIEKYLIQWNWCHVKGYQDNQVGPLDIWSSLNIKCDTAAKQIWAQDQDNT